MKHLFVPSNIAFVLKEKGFDEPCFTYYHPDDDKLVDWIEDDDDIKYPGDSRWNTYKNSDYLALYTAPLYQQVVDWFRDKHNICIYVDETNRPHIMGTILPTTGRIEYPRLAEISRIVGVSQHRVYTWPTYYEALTEAIIHAIKLI